MAMKIPYQGELIDANEVESVTSKEEWNEYQLANGDVLLTKTVMVRALKATDVKLPDGTPLYHVNTQTIVKVRSSG